MTKAAPARPEIAITLVVAVSRNGVIGKDGGLPWRLSSDLKRFKANTIGRPVVMGRKTFQSIGKALPGRDNVVVTRDRSFEAEGVVIAPDIAAALDLARARAKQTGAAEICVIGGGEIYRQTFDGAHRLIVTYVEADIEGDIVFPCIDSNVWEEISSEPYPTGEKDSHATRHVVYERRV
jgi:dihydrofolate reductase